jgi:cellulose biosynthesis protein BcsQ
MSSVHFVLQGKGGVGKSLIAALLAQYFDAKTDDIFCADTDSVNDTFARYKAFNADKINILNTDKNIDARVFDGLIEKILGHQGVSIIDNGASTFVPLSAYMKENGVIELLRESGKEVYIHTVLTGGQAMEDTMIGLNALLLTQPAPIVVWENEFFGEVAKDGKRFLASSMYEKNRHRIKGIVTIHKRNSDTFGKDLEMMIKEKMTFEEALSSHLFTVMPRQRLKMIKTSLFDQITAVGF